MCKKCGAEIQSSSTEGAYEQQTGYAQNRPGPQSGSGGDKSLATWALVIGIISFLTMGLFGVLATVGLTLGVIALVKTSQKPGQYAGKGRAVAGLVLSSLSGIAVPIAIIAAIAIPNLLAARRSANEGSALYVMRKIFTAEATYQAVHGKYGELADLANEHLIDSEVISGPRNGYKFAVSGLSADGVGAFELTGVPVLYQSSGVRSFYIDESGVIRAADKHGGDATRLDPPLREMYPSSPYRRTSDQRSSDEDE